MEEYNFNMDNWEYFCSYCRWYPDIFLDLIKPERGGLNQCLDQRVYLRSMLRFMSFYGVFPRGYGKCVTGDTMIYTDDGIKEIGELFNYNSSNIQRCYPTQVGVVNRYGQIEKTTLGIYSGFQRTKKVKTKEGFEICGTYNHPVLTVDDNGDIVFKKLEELKIGDYLVINTHNDLWGDNCDIDKTAELNAWVANLPFEDSYGLYERPMPKVLTEDIARFLGFMTGKGWVEPNGRIVFRSFYGHYYEEYEDMLRDIFGAVNVQVDDTAYYYLCDRYLAKYLELIGFKRSESYCEEIPSCILSTNRENVEAFLRGLYDSASGVSGAVTLNVSSEKLARQLQVLLLNFGVVSEIEKHAVSKSLGYRINIFGSDMLSFQENIGFHDYKKYHLLDSLCFYGGERLPNKHVIPNQVKRIIKLLKDPKLEYPYTINSSGRRQRDLKYYRQFTEDDPECDFTYNDLDKFLLLDCPEDNTEYKALQKLKEYDYYFAKIVSIKDGEEHVYDFHVPETHSFVSNGIVSHNTFNEVLASILACIFYPEISISISAQTKENAAALLKEKYTEITRFYPMLKNEVSKTIFSKNEAEVYFVNGSRLDNLANSQSSKGQRRRRMNIEESELINNDTFQDALLPIVEVPRVCVGKYSIIDPEEMNQQINFFTTAGFRGSDEFQRSVKMVQDMLDLQGKMVLGSSYWLPCWYGRGSTKAQIFQKKSDMSMIAFAQNYESKWVGASDGALVNINRLMDCRSLTIPSLSAVKNEEYYIGVDVARSQKTSNNQSFIAIVRVIRSKDKSRIISYDLVNLINIPNIMNFTSQAATIKKYKKLYNAQAVVVDGNGLGAGLIDECLKESFDPITKESLGCWDTINDDNVPEYPDNAEKILYNLKAQTAQSRIITNFIDIVDSGRLRMLVSKQSSDFTEDEYDDFDNKVAPFLQTDALFEEIANLKLKHLPNGGLTLEKVVSKMDKDRVSATIYVLWMINEYYKDLQTTSDYEYSVLIN